MGVKGVGVGVGVELGKREVRFSLQAHHDGPRPGGLDPRPHLTTPFHISHLTPPLPLPPNPPSNTRRACVWATCSSTFAAHQSAARHRTPSDACSIARGSSRSAISGQPRHAPRAARVEASWACRRMVRAQASVQVGRRAGRLSRSRRSWWMASWIASCHRASGSARE